MGDQAAYLQNRVAELEAENARLRTAMAEIQRRTSLLLTQNAGRWSTKIEHDRRTMDVLGVNQEIASEALGTRSP